MLTTSQQRLTNLFEYFKAIELRQRPRIFTLEEQFWHLFPKDGPVHPFYRFDPSREHDEGGWLSIKKPKLTACPAPPQALTEWLLPDWSDINATEVNPLPVITSEERGTTRLERFEESPQRLDAFANWKAIRSQWIRAERPSRNLERVWNDLFAIHNDQKREAEKFDLMLGSGIFAVKSAETTIHHPLVMRKVTLEFEPISSEFRFVDKEHKSEFFSSAFIGKEFEYFDVRRWSETLLLNNFHPLDAEPLVRFYRAIVGSLGDGKYTDEHLVEISKSPVISNQPVIFLRRRETGRTEFIDKIIQNIRETDRFPVSLIGIVGLTNNVEEEITTVPSAVNPNEQVEYPLTKPANLEQLEILRKLSNKRDVIVQGPPGTGKTHTIANVIGNLLSQGKSVLVTAHTAKALRVLRDKVAAPLRNLCVSILENDRESRTQRETAIRELSTRLSHDPEQYEGLARKLADSRNETLSTIRTLRSRLHSVVAAEYLPLPIQGEPIHPISAGKFVVETEAIHNWLPGPIHDTRSLPISRDDVVFLYSSGITLTPADERELQGELPALSGVLDIRTFKELVDQEKLLTLEPSINFRADLWRSTSISLSDLKRVAEAVTDLAKAARDHAATRWKIVAMEAGSQGSAKAKIWDLLLSDIEAVREQASSAAEVFFKFRPQLHRESKVEEQKSALRAIENHLSHNGSLSWTSVTALLKGWRRQIEQWVVLERRPVSVEEFSALRVRAELELSRFSLSESWEHMMVPLGVPSIRSNPAPEEYATQFVNEIRTLLIWHTHAWLPVQRELERCGLNWIQLLNEAPKTDSEAHITVRLLHVVGELLMPVIDAHLMRVRLRGITTIFDRQVEDLVAIQRRRALDSATVMSLVEATHRRSITEYIASHGALAKLKDLEVDHQKREQLLTLLDPLAAKWAAKLRARATSNEHELLTFDPVAAWRFRQIVQELDRRSKTQVSTLLETLGINTAKLETLTAQFVEASAWFQLLRRVTSEQRQALLGWGATMKKIGAGTGKRVPALLEQARQDMEKARGAVPVWIMPFANVTAMFDPVRDRFDVLIVDEASQEDVLGIATFYMAKQVVVVGDDEQVTPLDVGGAQEPVDALIGTWLRELPSPMLFDPKTSVYDRALISFGSVVRLREHFRCVPEIIQFSNTLCYNNEIKPLRESNSTPIKPPLVPFYVDGHVLNKVNQNEADQICRLIKACIECPEYEGKTIGVISMVGDAQWKLIDWQLRRLLDPITFEARKILCGNARQFQGDERDVIFLSIVDAKDEEGPLTFRGDGAEGMWKKFFNVAASRARDQLWIVYSVDPKTQLKQGDVRRRLIEHALDPDALMTDLRKGFAKTDSPFEKDVLSFLLGRGYDVTPQWEVGAYRIDLVVQGSTNRLAIECDGDSYHDPKVEEDLSRQVLLERLGWKFARIRASDFYRDTPNKHANAMTPILLALQNLGITPTASLINSASVDSGLELIERVKRLAASFQSELLDTRIPPVRAVHSRVEREVQVSVVDPEPGSVQSHLLDQKAGDSIDEFVQQSGNTLQRTEIDQMLTSKENNEVGAQGTLFSPAASERSQTMPKSSANGNTKRAFFRLNDTVEHGKFGAGVIKSIIGSGDSQTLEIEFAPTWGTRTIVAKFVKHQA